MAAPLLPLVAGAGLIFGLFGLLGGDDDKGTTPSVPSPPVPGMTCDQAVALLPAEVKASVGNLLLAKSLTKDQAASAMTLALALETAASSPGLGAAQRQALLVAAKCVRDAALAKVATDYTPPSPIPSPASPVVLPKPVLPGGGAGGGLPGPKLAAPALYGDANGVDWIVTNPAAGTWLASLDGPPPSSLYASGLPFMRTTRDQIVSAIEERAAMAASAGSGGS